MKEKTKNIKYLFIEITIFIFFGIQIANEIGDGTGDAATEAKFKPLSGSEPNSANHGSASSASRLDSVTLSVILMVLMATSCLYRK